MNDILAFLSRRAETAPVCRAETTICTICARPLNGAPCNNCF